MIKDNLTESVIGLDDKLAAGLIYARTIGNPSLAGELRSLGARELPDSPTQSLARAISPSPAAVDQGVLDSSRAIPPDAAPALELLPKDRLGAPRESVGRSKAFPPPPREFPSLTCAFCGEGRSLPPGPGFRCRRFCRP
jgi:hypothetical protein